MPRTIRSLEKENRITRLQLQVYGLQAQNAALLEALTRIASDDFTPRASHYVYNLDGMLTEVQAIATAAIAAAEKNA